ncbi:MAG: hypothetical protein WC227_03095 [Patescibacteria group bacterium]|jgi:hypothetical protein
MNEKYSLDRAAGLIKANELAKGDPVEKANRAIMRQKLLDLKGAFGRLMDLSKKNLPEGAEELALATNDKQSEIDRNEHQDTAEAQKNIKQIHAFMDEISDTKLAAKGTIAGKEILSERAVASNGLASIQESLGKLSVLRADVSSNIETLSELSMQDREEIETLQTQIDQLLEHPGLVELYAEDAERAKEQDKVDAIFSKRALSKLESFISQTSHNGLDKEVSPGVMREALYLMIKGEAQRLGIEVDQIDSQTISGIMLGLNSTNSGRTSQIDAKPNYTPFSTELNAKNKERGVVDDKKSEQNRGVLIGAALRQMFTTGHNEIANDFRDLVIALDYNNPEMSHDQGLNVNQRTALTESSSGVIQSQMEFINFVKAARESGVLGTKRLDRPYEDFQGSKVTKGEPIAMPGQMPEDRAKSVEAYIRQREKIEEIVVAEHESNVGSLKANIEKQYSEQIGTTTRHLEDTWKSNNGKDAIYPKERVHDIIVEYIANTFAAMKIRGENIGDKRNEIGKILQGITSNASFDNAINTATSDQSPYSRKEKAGLVMGIALRDAMTIRDSNAAPDYSRNSPLAEIVDAVSAMEGGTRTYSTRLSQSEQSYNTGTIKRVFSSLLPTMNLVTSSDGFFDGGLKNAFNDPKSQKMLEIGGFKLDDSGAIIPTKASGEYPAPHITAATVEQIKSDYREALTRTAGEVESGAEKKLQSRLAELRQTQELFDSILKQGDIFEDIKKSNQSIEKKQDDLTNLDTRLNNQVINTTADVADINRRNFIQKMHPKHNEEAVAAKLALDLALNAQLNPDIIRAKIESEIDELSKKLEESQAVIAKLPPEITSRAELEAARTKVSDQITQLGKE